MPIIPKVKDIPATGIEYRIRVYDTFGAIYGQPLLWKAGFLTASQFQQPYPDGDITVPLDAFAMQLGANIKAAAATGFTVKVGRRWLFDGGVTDFDNVGEIPPVVQGQ